MGLTRGVIGFLISIALLATGTASPLKDANSISFLAGNGAQWSVIGLIGSVLSLASKRYIAIVDGVDILISAFGLLLFNSVGIFYGLSFTLLLIAGIMAFRSKHIEAKPINKGDIKP